MQRFLSVATEAARAAGDLIRERIGAYSLLETKGNAQDLVTDVDRASEALISWRILSAFPDHAILGEEGMTEGAARHDRSADPAGVEHLWVCDPIDGTTNFVHGLPACTVAICLAVRGEPVLGVVYDPVRDEMFTAARGLGAFVNGRPMRVRTDARLEESLVATGFSPQLDVRSRNVAGLVAVSPLVRNIRAMGSAELHLAYVAAGRLTGFWEEGLSPWDLAAGYVLVTEAGGTVTELNGAPYGLATADILATNGPLHGELHRVLAEASRTARA